MSINQYPEWIKCNELNAIQSQEIIALKKRIKRLEDAGDGMRIWITVIRGYLPECTNIWRKAKEEKP
jgi:hypothetical protein